MWTGVLLRGSSIDPPVSCVTAEPISFCAVLFGSTCLPHLPSDLNLRPTTGHSWKLLNLICAQLQRCILFCFQNPGFALSYKRLDLHPPARQPTGLITMSNGEKLSVEEQNENPLLKSRSMDATHVL